jgi:hypothetical protein
MRADFNARYRHPVNLRGSLDTSGRAPIEVQVCNLSLAGAMIEHRYRLVPGQPCVLRLELEKRPVVLEGAVVWSHPCEDSSEGSGTEVVACRSGLHFGPLVERAEIHLRQSLARLASPRPTSRFA